MNTIAGININVGTAISALQSSFGTAAIAAALQGANALSEEETFHSFMISEETKGLSSKQRTSRSQHNLGLQRISQDATPIPRWLGDTRPLLVLVEIPQP